MLVHTINKHGQPLMPCSPRKARLLLKAGKARPAKGKSGQFTIQLVYGSSGYKQPVTVGIDTGAKVAPIAAVCSENGKVLYAKEVILRSQNIKKQLNDRRQYRRGRRSRLRYRKPRFDNRVKTKCSRCGVNNVPKKEKGKGGRELLCRLCKGKKGQELKPHVLAPSVKHRADSILSDVRKLAQSLPINKVIVETTSFDTQKMANKDIQGKEYQEGTLFECEVWYYLLQKFGNECAYCRGASGDRKLELEHVVSKSNGGTNKISNLVVACRTCNEEKGRMYLSQWERKLRRESQIEIDDKGKEIIFPIANRNRIKNIPKIEKQTYLKGKPFKYSALTQSYKSYLVDELKKVYATDQTRGAVTKYRRGQLKLRKSQINDAMVIASDNGHLELPDDYIVERRLKKRQPVHEYWLQNRKGQAVVRNLYTPLRNGFRHWDRVLCNHPDAGQMEGYVTTRKRDGSCRISYIDGTNALAKALDKKDATITYKKLTPARRQLSNYVREWKAIPREETTAEYATDNTGQVLLPYFQA